jgi:N utilization substance protein B
LLCHLDVPVSVVINEAVEIGKRYGTKETPAFVNGILDRISRTCRPVAAP